MVPSIGRRVWYWPSQKQLDEGILRSCDCEQALEAGVIFVHHSESVNLLVTDHLGRSVPLLGIPLLQARLAGTAQWMPYQVQEAAKASAAKAFNPNAGKASGVPAPLNKGK